MVAGSKEEFLRWTGKRDPNETGEERVRYIDARSTDAIRGRKQPEFLFLKGWQRRPEKEWRAVYNKALAVGKRWWER